MDNRVVRDLVTRGLVRPDQDVVLILRRLDFLDRALKHAGVVTEAKTLEAIQFRKTSGGLEVVADDPGRDALLAWAKSKRDSYNKIMAAFAREASGANEGNINKRKRLDGFPEMAELIDRKGEARLFIFRDHETGAHVFVAAGAYEKQGRKPQKERKLQNAAIERADTRRLQWQKAERVPGAPNVRIYRGVGR